MVHSFLLIGQSNAAGRGFFTEAGKLETCAGRLKVLRNGCWLEMYRPVNPDRSFSGTCLAESFAKSYADTYPNVDVGIIPCADGGTSLEKWQPGEILFDNAINCARLAMRTSHLVAVLWHQGEADCRADRYPLYRQRFENIMHALRKELGIPDLPVILGGLGDFLPLCTHSEHLKNYHHVNDALKTIASENFNCAFVSAAGLGANPDNLHFNADALKEFGIRYFNEFQRCFGDRELDVNPKEDIERTSMELL